jgi:hypothetical protein
MSGKATEIFLEPHEFTAVAARRLTALVMEGATVGQSVVIYERAHGEERTGYFMIGAVHYVLSDQLQRPKWGQDYNEQVVIACIGVSGPPRLQLKQEDFEL